MAPPDIYTNLIAFSLAKKAVFLMIAKTYGFGRLYRRLVELNDAVLGRGSWSNMLLRKSLRTTFKLPIKMEKGMSKIKASIIGTEKTNVNLPPHLSSLDATGPNPIPRLQTDSKPIISSTTDEILDSLLEETQIEEKDAISSLAHLSRESIETPFLENPLPFKSISESNFVPINILSLPIEYNPQVDVKVGNCFWECGYCLSNTPRIFIQQKTCLEGVKMLTKLESQCCQRTKLSLFAEGLTCLVDSQDRFHDLMLFSVMKECSERQMTFLENIALLHLVES